MATYIWTGANNDGNINAVGNWSGGQVPIGGPDTIVVIGHNYYYPYHTISSWPNGGNLNMEIATLYLAPCSSYWDQGGSGTVTIGSESNRLKISKAKNIWCGGFGIPAESWKACPVKPYSEMYLHVEQWDEGPLCNMTIDNHMEGGALPHAPRWTIDVVGTLNRMSASNAQEVSLNWGSTETNIAGTSATKAQNGPLKFGYELGYFAGAGYGFTNSVLNLDWQAATNSGNPVKDCGIDLMYSTCTVSADDYEEGDFTSLSLSSVWENNAQLEDGNIYYIRGVGALGSDTTPIDIPTLELTGKSLAVQNEIHLSNTTKCYIQAGVTTGGQATGSGFTSEYFDTIFDDNINSPVNLKSGLIKYRSRIDASSLTPDQFIIKNEDTETGIDIMIQDSGWGWAESGAVKIKPPMNSNIRIA